MKDNTTFEARGVLGWGKLMQEVEECGLSVVIHHDAYPMWTCQLWRDVGRTHIDVEAKAWSGIDALREALKKVDA